MIFFLSKCSRGIQRADPYNVALNASLRVPINGSIYLRRKISYTKKKQNLEDDRKRKVKVCCVCEECKVQKRKSTHSLFGSTSFPLFSIHIKYAHFSTAFEYVTNLRKNNEWRPIRSWYHICIRRWRKEHPNASLYGLQLHFKLIISFIQ